METYSIDCDYCEKNFKSFWTLSKHQLIKHGKDTRSQLKFKNKEGKAFIPPKPKVLDMHELESYKHWLAGITERVNSQFHPRLPGKCTNNSYINSRHG